MTHNPSTSRTNRLRRHATAVAALVLLATLVGCGSRQPVYRYPAHPYGRSPSPLPAQPAAAPAVHNDPINNLDTRFLRSRAQQVLSELVAALPAQQRQMVDGIPLVVDDTVGEVNAYAACRSGEASMAISDGLLEIQAQMARARANDEVFGTRKFQAYVKLVAEEQRPKRPVVRPDAAFFNRAQDTDARKVERQHQLLDEQIAFVLGHELAHHYLQHTGCVGRRAGTITPADLGRVLSNKIPVFNQPAELAADTWGINNTLSAGARRSGHRWTEDGARLTLQFFSALRRASGGDDVLFSFEMTHPHPTVRLPVVANAANAWRASGGRQLPAPLPGLAGLHI